MIGDTLGSRDSGIAFGESWAVMPQLLHAINGNDGGVWAVLTENGWEKDDSLYLTCLSSTEEGEAPDNTIFLDVTGWSWDLSGFYVQTGDESPLFSQIAIPGGEARYLYKVDSLWIVGDIPFAEEGLAYVADDALLPAQITNHEWNFAHDNQWIPFHSFVISSTRDFNIYAMLWEHRRIRYLPEKQDFFELRNNLVMPSFGLGTGGINPEVSRNMIRDSLRIGYRMLDLAREYRNEAMVSEIFDERADSEEIPLRHEVFLVTKVWPTHLGFQATSDEIARSMYALKTSYIDMYMIHWPM